MDAMSIRKSAFTFVAITVMSLGMTVTAMAATTADVKSKLSKIDSSKVSVDSSGNLTIDGSNVGVLSATDNNGNLAGLTIGGKTWFVDQSTLDDIDTAADSAIANQQSAANDTSAKKVGTDIKQISDNFNLKADTATASVTLAPFQNALSTISGLIVYGMLILLTFSNGLDICYLSIPWIQSLLDGKASDTKTNSDGSAKVPLVSAEASYAHKQAETGEDYRNPLLIYASKRVVFLIVDAILVFMLLTGQMGLLIQIVLNLFSGFIDVIQSAAMG